VCVCPLCSCDLLISSDPCTTTPARRADQEEYDANEAEAEDTVGELPSSSESIHDSNPSLAISSFSDYISANELTQKTEPMDERQNETQSTIDIIVNPGDSNGNSINSTNCSTNPKPLLCFMFVCYPVFKALVPQYTTECTYSDYIRY
jgi:hypothetical protein